MKENWKLSEVEHRLPDRQKMGRDNWIMHLLKPSPAVEAWIVL